MLSLPPPLSLTLIFAFSLSPMSSFLFVETLECGIKYFLMLSCFAQHYSVIYRTRYNELYLSAKITGPMPVLQAIMIIIAKQNSWQYDLLAAASNNTQTNVDDTILRFSLIFLNYASTTYSLDTSQQSCLDPINRILESIFSEARLTFNKHKNSSIFHFKETPFCHTPNKYVQFRIQDKCGPALLKL